MQIWKSLDMAFFLSSLRLSGRDKKVASRRVDKTFYQLKLTIIYSKLPSMSRLDQKRADSIKLIFRKKKNILADFNRAAN